MAALDEIKLEKLKREKARRQGGGATAPAAAPAVDPYLNVGLSKPGQLDAAGNPAGTYEPSLRGTGRAAYDLGKVAADAYTFGLADVAGGGRARTDKARENLGHLGTGIELAASVASPALLAKVPVAAFKGAKTLYRGAESGTGAALDAYTHGAPLSSLPGEFVMGAGISEALAQVARPVSKWWTRRQNIKNQTYKNADELQAAKDRKYDEVDASNAKFQARDLRKLHARLNSMDLVPGIDDPAINVLKKLEKDWTGKDMSPAELDSVRQFVRKKLGQDPRQGSVASDMVKSMDKFAETTPVYKAPASGIGPPAPSPGVNEALIEARDLHGRQKRLEMVIAAGREAKRAVTKSRFNPFGTSPESADVAKFSKIAENADKGKIRSKFTDAELEGIRRIEQGNWLRDTGGRAEHLSFSGGLLPWWASVPLAKATGGVSLGVQSVAEIAHRIGRGATARELEDLKALIRDPTGKGIAPSGEQLEKIKNRIAKLMAAGYRTQNRRDDGGPR